jgi:hypothetical protein
MRVACWRPKATNAHSEYVILMAPALQQWLHERISVLHYTYIVCLFLVIGSDLVFEVEISLEVQLIYKDRILVTFYKISIG